MYGARSLPPVGPLPVGWKRLCVCVCWERCPIVHTPMMRCLRVLLSTHGEIQREGCTVAMYHVDGLVGSGHHG